MKRVLQHTASLVGGEAAVRAGNYAALLWIARMYGAATLGTYAICLAVLTVVVMFADAGLVTAAIPMLSRESAAGPELLARLTVCKVTLLLLAGLALVVSAGIARPAPLFLLTAAWLALRTMLQSVSQLQIAALKSALRTNWVGVIQAMHAASLFLGLWLGYELRWSFSALLAWLTAAQAVELLLAMIALAVFGMFPRWPASFGFGSLLKSAAPFGIVTSLANLIIRLDTILLSSIVSLPELGAFTASNSLLLLIYLGSWLFGTVLLPDMVRIAHDSQALYDWTREWLCRVSAVAIPASLVAAVAAPRLVVSLFGPAYAASGAPGAVMLLASPLILLNSVYTTAAFALNRRGTLIVIYAVTSALTIVLDLVLGKTLGALGVACGVLLREAAMTGMLHAFLFRAAWREGKLALRGSAVAD